MQIRRWGIAVLALAGGIFSACTGGAETEQPIPTASPSIPQFPEDCRANPPDGQVIAYRILAQGSSDLLLPAAEAEGLVAEAEGVLSRIRAEYPSLSEIHTIPEYALGQVIIGTTESLAADISRAMGGQRSAGPIVSGHVALDQLNRDLRFTGLTSNLVLRSFLICIDRLTDIESAAEAYNRLDGVLYAEPNFYGGDGSDIAVERQEDTWYVVFREGLGDCPAGCTDQNLYFFVADRTGVREVAWDAALSHPVLRGLAETWGAWRLAGAAAPDNLPKGGGRP